MILRAKTVDLIETKPLTPKRAHNSELNIKELKEGQPILSSFPRRLVFELTNVCNLSCVMCGRNAADFKPTIFKMEWFDKFYDIFSQIEEVTLMGWGEPTVHPGFIQMLEILDRFQLRKYFCTNAMKLDVIKSKLFETNVDVIGVSLDGADSGTNNRIRKGADFDKIVSSLRDIVNEKRTKGLSYPYINFVFTAMKSNFKQLPDLVRLAADIGIEEVKVVYLTAFDDRLSKESLWNNTDELRKVFIEAQNIAEELGLLIKLPHLRGEDPAKEKCHKDCFVAWRDFFLGSDGYVRPCMNSSTKLFPIWKYHSFKEMWNSPEYVEFRTRVNMPGRMDIACARCYQSSHANWNRQHAFLQLDNIFSPNWED